MELASQLSEAWARTRVHWQGEPADAFYREYILSMEECCQRFDAACGTLKACANQLEDALSAIEQDMNM